MPKDLDDLLLFAVDPSGLDLSKLTEAAGGLRDASGQLVRLARPVTEEFSRQGSKSLPAVALVGIAAVGLGVGVVVTENRSVIGRKARDAWSRVRGVAPAASESIERTYDPLKSESKAEVDGDSPKP